MTVRRWLISLGVLAAVCAIGAAALLSRVGPAITATSRGFSSSGTEGPSGPEWEAYRAASLITSLWPGYAAALILTALLAVVAILAVLATRARTPR